MAIEVTRVTVEVSGEFGGPGEPGFNITYQAKVEGDATDEELRKLIIHTDKVSEIHNTLRAGVSVNLVSD